MTNRSASPSTFNRDISHAGLALIRQRFLKLNHERLIHTRTALLSRQQIFLDLLPLLIHINHPILPGYISHDTPCTVCF
jgi:adenylate cyclase class 1